MQTLFKILEVIAFVTICIVYEPAFAKYEALLSEPIKPIPAEPVEVDVKKLELGQLLFQEVRLSKDNSVSCLSCHNISTSGADGLVTSIGVRHQKGDINAPSVFNARYNFKQFWNGRAASLEEQIDGPIQNPKEMGSSWGEIVSKLQQDLNYKKLFLAAYKEEPNSKNIKDALVIFEKTLVTKNARFDQFLQGDMKAITDVEKLGYQKFKSFGCVACHQGMNIGGNMYQTMGVMGDYFKDRGTPITDADLGLYTLTKKDSDKHVFRVPSLRNIELTAPYFHDGSAKTLEQAVSQMTKYQLGRSIANEDLRSIVAFLKTLTGEKPKLRAPASLSEASK